MTIDNRFVQSQKKCKPRVSYLLPNVLTGRFALGPARAGHMAVSMTGALFYICDPSEQKQPFGCTLTNPSHVTPLRPDSTVIDGFSKLIPQRIAVEISYLLVYCS